MVVLRYEFFFGFRPLQCLLVGWVGVCVLSARALHHFLRVMDMSCHFSSTFFLSLIRGRSDI